MPALSDIAIFGGVLVVVILLAWLAMGQGDSRMAKRISRMKNRNKVVRKGVEDAGTLRRKKQESSLPLMKAIMEKLPRLSMLTDRLERAGVNMTAEKYILINLGILALVILLFALAGKAILIGIFLGVALGIGAPHFAINVIIGKQLKKFIQLFPDGIDLIVRGLRSGLPVTESMTTVATEVSAPVGPIFAHVTDQVRLGVPLEKALQDTAKRLDCTEFNFFVTSLILQRETGGNLSEILNNLSEVLRTRVMMKMKIKAMSSEARASAMIVGALPFVVSTILAFVSPEYLAPLATDFRGNVAVAVALGMMGFGSFVMYKMTQFEL